MLRRNLSMILSLLSLVLLVAVFLLNYRQAVRLIETFHQVEDSHITFIKLSQLESYLKDMQRSHRGFVISRHRESLRPFESAVDHVPVILLELETTYMEQPSQLKLLDSLSTLFNLKIAYVRDAINQVNRGAYDSAMLGTEGGRLLLNNILDVLHELTANQQQLYQAQKSDVEAEARRILIIVVSGLVLSALLLIVATGRAYRRQIATLNSELDTANTELETTNAALLNANLELKKSNESLEKLNRELNDFSYSVSHDLKAPLRAIRGFCDMLLDEPEANTNERVKRLVGVITQNARRMDELINDLLKLARLGNTPITRQNIDMREIVDQVLHEKSLKPGTKINIFAMGKAHGDAGLLKQVWENLINNAIKFSQGSNPPLIEIGTKRNNSEQWFWVKDNGVGFDSQYDEKLFKVFSRLHGKNEFEGTGAGLAIVKKIIDAHGGRTWAEGQPEKGATFYFSLPLKEPFHEHS